MQNNSNKMLLKKCNHIISPLHILQPIKSIVRQLLFFKIRVALVTSIISKLLYIFSFIFAINIPLNLIKFIYPFMIGLINHYHP